MGRLVRVGVVGADESLLGIAGLWRCGLYSVGRREVSRRGCKWRAGMAEPGRNFARYGESMLLSLARGPGWFVCASWTGEA